MRLIRLILILTISILVTSCVFVPVISEEQIHATNCKLQTRNLTISVAPVEGRLCSSQGSERACLIFWGAVVPAGSLIVSGSIVLVGNVIHWLEVQSHC